jgi:hypothetical protein
MARYGLLLGLLKKTLFVTSTQSHTAFTRAVLLCRMYSCALSSMCFSMKINVFDVKVTTFTSALYPSKLVFMLNSFV